MFRFLLFLALFCASFAYAKPILTLYAYDSFTGKWGAGPAVEKAFEAECECDLQMVGLDSSLAVLSRLQLEGDKTKADIILGLDSGSMLEAKKTNLLQNHGIKTDNLSVPLGWEDKTFLPFDYGYFAFVYNKNKVKNPPKSMQELVENKDKLKIVFSDARFSAPGFGLLSWIKYLYDDKATEAWKKISPHVIAVPPSWSSAYKLFTSGEADLVLSYTTSPAYHIINDGNNDYAFAEFKGGHYMQIEVAAMTKNANKELAQKFLRFMISEKFQTIIPKTNTMYPVINIDIPDAFGKAPKALLFPADKVSQNRKEWLDEWQNALHK